MSNQFSYRPWGYWKVIEEKPGYKIKELYVQPGMALSKQYHKHRDEHWLVLEGTGEVVLESFDNLEKTFYSSMTPLSRGVSLSIKKRVVHKLINTGTKPLLILETQIGSICNEDDIVRLD